MKVTNKDIGWGSSLNITHETIKEASHDPELQSDLERMDKQDMGRVGTKFETRDVGDGVANEAEAKRWVTHLREGDIDATDDEHGVAEFVRGLTKEIRTFADVEAKESGNRTVYKNEDAGLRVKMKFGDGEPSEMKINLEGHDNAVVILKALDGYMSGRKGELVLDVPENGKLEIDLKETTMQTGGRFRAEPMDVPLQMLGGRISRGPGMGRDVNRRMALIVLTDVDGKERPNILDRVVLGFPSENDDYYGE